MTENMLQTIDDWKVNNKIQQLWAKDASLWTGQDESKWMGWLNIVDQTLGNVDELEALTKEIKKEGFTDLLLLGMGGSSLCPQVLAQTFGQKKGFPKLHVLDSTDPQQIGSIEKRITLEKTLFVVSSKSGSTLEPNIFKKYFFTKAKAKLGEKTGSHFIAVTDPGSKLEELAKADGFRKIFHGVPSIGGRYSALSNFGIVPAALMGLDVRRFLENAQDMVRACSPSVLPEKNPGVLLGVKLGLAANSGQDKATFIIAKKVEALGAWLEQLLAESTGKAGKGIIPIDKEPLGGVDEYSKDRLIVSIKLKSETDKTQEKLVDELEKAAASVVRLSVEDPLHLGAEFFRWEMATAIAGSLIGINPFNQPDVEASKVETKKLTSNYEKEGKLPEQKAFFEDDNFALFTDAENQKELVSKDKKSSLQSVLCAHFNRIKKGDYFDLAAFIEMNEANEDILNACRALVRDKKHVATCLGFGPRFLHSTGQAYKGGPNSGVFLQITCEDAKDLEVPEHKYSFGVVKECQARGDFAVLLERKRRSLRVHIKGNLSEGLKKLKAGVEKALTP